MTLNTTNYEHLLSKENPINRLLFINYLKVYGKTEHELQLLVHTFHIISKDIGIEFRMKKRQYCAHNEREKVTWTTK